MAMFLTMFDCELVDDSGHAVIELPQPRRDNLYVLSGYSAELLIIAIHWAAINLLRLDLFVRLKSTMPRFRLIAILDVKYHRIPS